MLVQLTRNRGRVEFMYDSEGSMRTSWMPVHKTKAVQALVEGQQVEILVHPTHVSHAMIAHLFC
jgi:RES domain-containing protein